MFRLIDLGSPFAIFFLLLQLISPVKANEAICLANLPGAIDDVKEREEWERSHFGILVETLEEDQTLYSHNSQQYFIPASNAKLFTTTAILAELGANYRIRTPIKVIGEAPNIEKLYIVTKGDPSLVTADLDQVVHELKAQGVQQVNELVVENAYFPNPAIVSSWEWADLKAFYGVGASSAILNENTFGLTLLSQDEGEPIKLAWNDHPAARQWRFENTAMTAPPETPYGIRINRDLGEPVLKISGEMSSDQGESTWGLAVRDPGYYFLETLRVSLLREGIQVQKGRVTTTPEAPNTEFSLIESPPLIDLVKKANLESNNLYAESLLRTLGKEANDTSPIQARENSLTALGVDSDSYALEDGSGLSRHNLASPSAIVQVLQSIADTPVAEIFRETLPVSGESGTLKHRFQETVATGRVQAKTGTMSGISVLSGYVEPLGVETLTFSILLNQSEQPIAQQREAIDEMVNLLAQVKECE